MGVFDGHGMWGGRVASVVRDSMLKAMKDVDGRKMNGSDPEAVCSPPWLSCMLLHMRETLHSALRSGWGDMHGPELAMCTYHKLWLMNLKFLCISIREVMKQKKGRLIIKKSMWTSTNGCSVGVFGDCVVRVVEKMSQRRREEALKLLLYCGVHCFCQACSQSLRHTFGLSLSPYCSD